MSTAVTTEKTDVDNGLWKIDAAEAMECVKILEKAGFSQNEVSEGEFDRVARNL